MFLLVPAHPGCPGQIPQSRKTVVCVCVWKEEYVEKLMNEENEWDHRISARVKRGPADCISIDEVASALK